MPTDVYQDFSEFYDLYVGDRLDDLPFYLEYASAAQTPVLEIGAGSGRLTIPLAQAGASVVAVDISSSMLAILEARLARLPAEVGQRVQVVEADACELELEERYDLIMVTFYTFNYFLTPQTQTALLGRLDAHLSHGGTILLDVFIPVSRIESCPEGPVLRVDKVDPSTGNRVRGWNIYRIDKANQMEYRRHIFEVTQSDGAALKKEFDVQRRYFLPSELEAVFAKAGFAVEAVYGGYRRELPAQSSEQLMYVLRRR